MKFKEELSNKFPDNIEQLASIERKKINNELYENIVKHGKTMLKQKYDKSITLIDAITFFSDVSKNENLNDVTDIYIYEVGLSKNPEELRGVIEHAILSIVTYEYEPKHFDYLERNILSNNIYPGFFTMSFYLNIGIYNKENSDRILNFVLNNLSNFSKNHIQDIVNRLSFFPKNNNIVDDISTQIELLYGIVQTKQTTKKTVKQNELKKAWWEFWK